MTKPKTWINVPATLEYSQMVLTETDCYNADYALIALTGDRLNCPVMRRWDNVRGECCMTLAIRIKGGTAIYGELALLTRGVRRTAQAAGITMLADQPLIDYGRYARALMLSHFWGDEVVPNDNKTAVAVLQVWGHDATAVGTINAHWPVSKITGEHHTLVLPSEAIQKMRHMGFRRAVHGVSLTMRVCGTRAWAAGVLLWFASADAGLVDRIMAHSTLWSSRDLNQWTKVAKGVSADLKMHQHYTELPLQQLFEFQVLLNRGIGSVSWTEEKRHRTMPETVPIKYGEVLVRAREMFSGANALGYVYAAETWGSYWQRRWASTPTGSMHSQYSEDDAYIVKQRQYRTKFFSALQMPDYPITHFLERQPEIVAWPSVKSEWGKERAIYGTDFTSYELTDFAMPAVEEALSHMFPIGRKANEKYVAARVKMAGADGIPVCFDFADFNSQHSLSSMLAVVVAYYDVHANSMSPDQQRAMLWVIKSVGVQRVEGEEPYVSKGTLLSGWRLTTLVNTVLNYVYLDWCGALKKAYDSVHNGDDVLMYYESVADAVVALKRARDAGIRAQPAKCVIAGIGEFLRVDREARLPTGSQYLCRAVATAVHARAEAGMPDNVRDALQAQNTRIDELAQRGAPAHVVAAMHKDAERNLARVFDMSAADLADMACTHHLQGGVSDDLSSEIKWRFEEPPGQFERQTGAVDLYKLPGIQSYAESLCRAFGLEIEHIAPIKKRLARATQKATTLERTALVKVKISDLGPEKIARGIYKTSSNEYAVANLAGKARMAGLPVGRLLVSAVQSDTVARIMTAKNPLRMMQIIF
jgi:hypothetical protein